MPDPAQTTGRHNNADKGNPNVAASIAGSFTTLCPFHKGSMQEKIKKKQLSKSNLIEK